MQEYLEAGIIVNTHGIDGAVMIKSLCDSNEILCSFKTLYTREKGEYIPHAVKHSAVHKGMVLCRMDGFVNPEQVAKYKTHPVYAKREDIPLEEGAHFICDLIGLEVRNIDTGKVYGTLDDVINNGAGDIYEIKDASGKINYVPAVDEFIREIDLESGILISPIEGMFDEI